MLTFRRLLAGLAFLLLWSASATGWKKVAVGRLQGGNPFGLLRITVISVIDALLRRA
jgi:hypothetical protein